MSLMDWNKDLDIGVAEMNHQHQDILKYMNQLYDQSQEDDSFIKAKPIIDKLTKVTVDHFSEEEAYMQKIEYIAFEAHKSIHKELLSKFSAHVERMQGLGKVDQTFFAFLKLWLTAHIKGLDMKYGEFSKKNAA